MDRAELLTTVLAKHYGLAVALEPVPTRRPATCPAARLEEILEVTRRSLDPSA